MQTDSEHADYLDNLWKQYFLRHCDEISQEGKIRTTELTAGLILPLHRYVTEAIILLGSHAFNSNLTDRIRARKLFVLLCERFKVSYKMDHKSRWIVESLSFPLFRPPRTSGAPLWLETLDFDRILPWMEHVPVNWLETDDEAPIMANGEVLFESDDLADPIWLVRIMASAYFTFELFTAWSVDRNHMEHAFLNSVENFAVLNVAEQALFKILRKPLDDAHTESEVTYEDEASRGVAHDFDTPANTLKEAERRARLLIAIDPSFAERMVKREWMRRIRCGAGMVEQLQTWQALPKRVPLAQKHGSYHDGIADHRASSPAHDAELARLIDEQAKEIRADKFAQSRNRSSPQAKGAD